MHLNFLAAPILVFFVVASHAQLRKCVGADGKITYSDVVCASATTDTPIRVRDNTLDSSGFRQEMDTSRAASERNELMRATPKECKFQYYEYGDARGKILAENANNECIDNKLASKSGVPSSLVAYQLWRDNYDQVSSRKQTNAVRDSIDGATNAIRSNRG